MFYVVAPPVKTPVMTNIELSYNNSTFYRMGVWAILTLTPKNLKALTASPTRCSKLNLINLLPDFGCDITL